MSFENFVTVFNKVKSHAKIVTLHNWAEPFLNPNTSKIIKFINKEAPGVTLHISSNGASLNEEKVRLLSGAKIDFLEISISGVTQDVYERYHKSGKIDKVFDNIRMLINNNELVIEKLSIKYIQFDYNILSYFTIKKSILKQLGIERFPPFLELKIIPGYVTAAVQGFEKKYPAQPGAPKSKKTPMKDDCNYPFEQLVVRSDGEVFPCCVVPYQKTFSLGNLLVSELNDIFLSETYRAFRESFIKGTNPVCNNCFLITTSPSDLPFDRFLVTALNRIINKL